MDDVARYLRRDWWVFAVRGGAAIAFGVAAFVWPMLTLAVLIMLFGAYVLVDGAFGFAYAMRNWTRLERGWLIGLDVLLFGILMIGSALRLRSAGRQLSHDR